MSVYQNVKAAGALAIDAQNLEQLKLQARREPGKAVAGAAKQFEAMFLGMVLKSMREATPQDGLFDNEQSRLYISMFDQQIAQQVAARGTGLAEVMARQLSGNGSATVPQNQPAFTLGTMRDPLPISTLTLATFRPEPSRLPDYPKSGPQSLYPAPEPGSQQTPFAIEPEPELELDAEPWPASGAVTPVPALAPAPASAPAQKSLPIAQTRDFVNRMWSHAVDAARSIGVKPQFMVGQAALESGWGRHEIRAADGSATFNVFGIKAGRSWKGAVVEKTTTEYVNGVAQKTTAKFRAYASYDEAFRDYASLLQNNPRYANVVGKEQDAQGFARGLQRAGYATDPAYADKLVRVINGTTLRQGLAEGTPARVLAQR